MFHLFLIEPVPAGTNLPTITFSFKPTNVSTLPRGKVDTLVGLKENVIVGRLVPAGTGSIKNKWNKKALDDDQKFIAEQEKIEQPETPVNQ